jgi:hypothetical protein
MPRVVSSFSTLLLLLAPTARICADSPAELATPWKFEAVHLKNGSVLLGLVTEETPQQIRFQNVRRAAGRPTVIIHTTFRRGEIARIEKLPEDDHKKLEEHVLALEQNTPQGEKERMGGLELKSVAWGLNPRGGWRYESDYFALLSDAPEEIVRRAALRLEQIYGAYARFLPPRHKGGQPTTVLLITDIAEYRKTLAAMNQKVLNLAFFDPAGNRIVCASDLRQLGDELARLRKLHHDAWDDLKKTEVEYAKLYKGKELAALLQQITEKRRQLVNADVKNDLLFHQATQLLFATLYHEAFHAYLAGFVYPAKTGEMPRWLNEGLAQIFETALIDAGELRIGHADAARLTRAKEAVRKGELIPLADLLRSGPKQFALSHIGDRQVSDRHYLTSWAVAMYLTFERRLLGSAALDSYVQSLTDGTDVKPAFEELVGQSLPQLETDLRKYLNQLQPDGSLAGKKD